MKRLLSMFVLLAALCATTPVLAAEIVCVTVEDPNNYDAVTFLNQFAKQTLRPAGHRVTIIEGNQPLPTDLPGLVPALKDADLLIVFLRRATLPPAQLQAIRDFLNAGRPLLAIRTANHAFLPRNKTAKPPAGTAVWLDFTPAVLGGQNTGYETRGLPYRVQIHPDAPADSPLLKAVDATKIRGYQSLYQVLPLAEDVTPLLIGTSQQDELPAQPVAWFRRYGPNKARVFYTSLGAPEDMQQAPVQQLLSNAVDWTLTR